jgi:HPt (histidine-containing phosphotransfer) domain-containing protein
MQSADMPVFDSAQLARRTNGDPKMQIEVLALFVAEAERLLRQVEDAANGEVRGERLRALIALARTTGAAMLAEQARSLEAKLVSAEPDLTPLREAVERTLAYLQHAGR